MDPDINLFIEINQMNVFIHLNKLGLCLKCVSYKLTVLRNSFEL